MNDTKITFSLALAKKILDMLNGISVPSSSFSSGLAKVMLAEGLITVITRGSRKSYRINHPNACRSFLKQHYTSSLELEDWIELKIREADVSRAELVNAGAHSKIFMRRGFRGFLVNCYETVEARLNGNMFNLAPIQGTSLFIEDYEELWIPEDVVIVGIENGENFQQIRKQKYLFDPMKVLFVSRYPQSSDLVDWLKRIPNRYIHFGDFDLAGIHIYEDEFYAYLGERASFFMPSDIEDRLKIGSTELYDKQYLKYKDRTMKDKRLLALADLIHRYRRGYEQEGYIR
ncbi:MAG: DUF7281 domain-containing protein [Bacteroidales bacterium]